MTKKNLRPQQVAPVQRETTAQSSLGEKGARLSRGTALYREYGAKYPFAGDDTE